MNGEAFACIFVEDRQYTQLATALGLFFKHYTSISGEILFRRRCGGKGGAI